MKLRLTSLLLVPFLAVGFALLVFLDGRARRTEPEQDPMKKAFSVPSAAVALVSLGARPLVADYLWIDAVQYIGRTLAHHKHDIVDGKIIEVGLAGKHVPVAAETVYRLVKRVTEVDPNFVYPYYITSLFLLDPHINPDPAMDLLRLGVERNPENWFLRTYYGFQLFVVERDVEGAVRELEVAAGLPGAAPYVESLKQNLRTASRRDLTMIFLKGALRRATTHMERERIRQQIGELESGRDLDLEHLDHHLHHHHSHDAREPEQQRHEGITHDHQRD